MQSFSPYQRNVSFILFPYVFIHRSVGFASAIVLTFFIHSERIPSRTRVDKVNEAVRFFCLTFDFVTRYAFHRFARPVSTDVGKHLRSTGEQLHKQHARCVECVVFRAENVRFSRPVPVERSVKNTFGEVAVRVKIRPLSLSLEVAL